jgi:signal peptidase I
MTIAMIPLLHNTIPILKTESYLKSPSLPYYRMKALETIDRYDPIVFNWPVGDSVYLSSQRSYTVSQVENMNGDFRHDPELARLYKNKDFRVRPLDKKDHYIKRCMAQSGDTIQIIDDVVYINGELAFQPSQMQLRYLVSLPEGVMKSDLDKTGITENLSKVRPQQYYSSFFIGKLTQEDVKVLENLNQDIVCKPVHMYMALNDQLDSSTVFQNLDLVNGQIDKGRDFSYIWLTFDERDKLKQDSSLQLEYADNPNSIFPNDDSKFKWTVANFGPLYIPKKGDSVVVTPLNLPLYKRIIGVYENNTIDVQNGKVHINGEPNSKYTFKQNYYWAMGDNRHDSEDSRMWGFVPEDHMVGKPLFIWFSLKNGRMSDGINWSRIFTSADVR